jgi:hypothetical protein
LYTACNINRFYLDFFYLGAQIATDVGIEETLEQLFIIGVSFEVNFLELASLNKLLVDGVSKIGFI